MSNENLEQPVSPFVQEDATNTDAIAQAVAHHRAGRLPEAAAIYEHTLQGNPNQPDALHMLGVIAHQLGKNEIAVSMINQAIQIAPSSRMHGNLALALAAQGQSEVAIGHFHQALALDITYIEAHNNLGNALRDQGKLDAAIDSYRQALRLNPNYAEAHNNLGNALRDQGKLDAAIESYRHALALIPDYPEVLSNLGTVYLMQGKLDASVDSFKKALVLKPNFVEAHYNLGNVFMAQGKLEAAVDSCCTALTLQPSHISAHSNLIFALDMAFDVDMRTMQEERKRWDDIHAAPLTVLQRPHTNRIDHERRLRIGYVSADFRSHSAASVFGAMLLEFDRSRFDVYAYSNTKNEDVQTQTFAKSVTCWRSIVGVSDGAAADLIRQDEIDILVDLSGHSAGNRLLVFARKPAPVQVTAWGYATSTGMKAMDAFFADSVMVPTEEKCLYTEDVRYLPNIVCYSLRKQFPAVSALPALSNGFVTFGSFNRLAKISVQTFQAWAAILSALPDSRLLIKAGELDALSNRDRVLGHFTQAGIALERITLLGSSSWEEHMAAFNQVDIALDPFPHSGGVTTLEGIMMGVPLVTLRWPTIIGRLSTSILTTLELTDWISETSEQYVGIAIQKAGQLTELASLRQQLRGMIQASIIGDTKAYVTAVESEYRKLWQEWCMAILPKVVEENLCSIQTGRLTS